MSFFVLKLLWLISSPFILFVSSSGVKVHFHQALPPTVISAYPMYHAHPESPHHLHHHHQHHQYTHTQFHHHPSIPEPEPEPEPELLPEPEHFVRGGGRGFVINLRLPRIDTSLLRSLMPKVTINLSFAPNNW